MPLSIMLVQQMQKPKQTDVKGKGVVRDPSGAEKKEPSSDWMDLVDLGDT